MFANLNFNYINDIMKVETLSRKDILNFSCTCKRFTKYIIKAANREATFEPNIMPSKFIFIGYKLYFYENNSAIIHCIGTAPTEYCQKGMVDINSTDKEIIFNHDGYSTLLDLGCNPIKFINTGNVIYYNKTSNRFYYIDGKYLRVADLNVFGCVEVGEIIQDVQLQNGRYFQLRRFQLFINFKTNEVCKYKNTKVLDVCDKYGIIYDKIETHLYDKEQKSTVFKINGTIKVMFTREYTHLLFIESGLLKILDLAKMELYIYKNVHDFKINEYDIVITTSPYNTSKIEIVQFEDLLSASTLVK